MRGPRVPVLSLVVTAVIAVPSVVFVVERTLSHQNQQTMRLTSSSGALAIANAEAGQAILTAAPMVPGTQTTGTVHLVNSGDSPELMTLDAGAPTDTPGPGGGRLSERLQLRVEDVAADGTASTVYDGALTGLHLDALGTWAANEAHTYRFVVTFPDGGSGGADNAYQGSSTSIGFTWTAAAGGPAEPPASAPYPDQVAGDQPLSYWPLDGTQSGMTDTVGSANGTYASTVTTASVTAPGGGSAAWFDGSSAYAYVDNVAAPTQAYTMEAWVRPATTDDMVILEHDGGGALAIRSGHFAFREVDTTLHGTSDVVPGQWQQVVGTWDASSDTARLYVNGQLEAEGPASTAPSGTSTFYVGRGTWPAGSSGTTSGTQTHATTAESYFHGEMAQVSYYATSLSSDRVTAHYTAGSAAPSQPATPAAPSTPSGGDSGAGAPAPTGSGDGSTTTSTDQSTTPTTTTPTTKPRATHKPAKVTCVTKKPVKKVSAKGKIKAKAASARRPKKKATKACTVKKKPTKKPTKKTRKKFTKRALW